VKTVGQKVSIQGNMDPIALFLPEEKLADRIRNVLKQAKGARGHIFNLGHGIIPETDPNQAKLAVEMAEKEVIMKKAPFLPKVTLSASYDKIGDDPGGSPTPGWPSENKMVQATASWKVWTALVRSRPSSAWSRSIARPISAIQTRFVRSGESALLGSMFITPPR